MILQMLQLIFPLGRKVQNSRSSSFPIVKNVEDGGKVRFNFGVDIFRALMGDVSPFTTCALEIRRNV